MLDGLYVSEPYGLYDDELQRLRQGAADVRSSVAAQGPMIQSFGSQPYYSSDREVDKNQPYYTKDPYEQREVSIIVYVIQ